jgi:hypothetical protein
VNRAALSRHQPGLAESLDVLMVDGQWQFARDGSLTARSADGQWFAGCSVPLLAGRALLRSLSVEPGGHCLLAPAHAGLVVALRERLGPDPVLFVLHPDAAVCRTVLGSADLSSDLAAGRLWFLTGDAWSTELQRVFDAHPGLAAPTRFVQTRLTSNAVVEPLIVGMQHVIGVVATQRAAELDRAVAHRVPQIPGRVTVIGASRFRLWVPGLDALRATLPGRCTVVDYDTDAPLTATPIALAQATAGTTAVVAANLTRGDVSAVVPADVQWITWQTRPPASTAAGVGPNDHLVVADPTWRALAIGAGWASDRVHVGACPAAPPLPAPATPAVALVCDTVPTVTPPAVRDYSSHLVLWEAIADELRTDPLAVDDPHAYLSDRAKRMGVEPAELNAGLFVDGLILPAYAQGLARLLIAHRLTPRLWGTGWSELAEFTGHAAGPVTDGVGLSEALASTTALVRHVPGRHWHPMDAYGRPIVSAVGLTARQWLSKISETLRGTTAPVAMRPTPSVQSALQAILSGA